MKRFLPYFVGALVGMLMMAAFFAGRASASPLAATGCFPDTNGHWAETFICWMKDSGISSGYPDGTYKPENNLTRAEMSVMLNKLDTNLNQAINTTTDTKINTAVAQVNSSTDTKINDTKTLMRATGDQLDTPVTLLSAQTVNIVPITITAPVNGALVINAVVRFHCYNFPTSFCTGAQGYSYVKVNGVNYDTSVFSIGANEYKSFSHTMYLPVSAGTHNLNLEINETTGSGVNLITGASLVVQFVPYDGSGAVPAVTP